MEFGVALFSAVAGVAVSKLCSVKGKPNIDATSISSDLGSIRAALRDHAKHGHVSNLWTEYIAQLRDLAYDIEDSIDRFHAKKTSPEEFATQLGVLKRRSEETNNRMHSLKLNFPGQGTAQAAPVVANDTTDFLFSDKSRHDCLVYLYLFPPKHDVRTKPLTRRWLAEGLVDGEQVAVNNLSSIIESSYINSTSIQRSNNGKVKRCQPTANTLENIAQRSLSENFIVVYDGTAQLPEERPRRLSVHCPANARLSLPQNLSCGRVRTLAVFLTATPATTAGGAPAAVARDEAVLDFSRYEVLRVLDLKERGPLSESDGHIQAICEQVLIRYLSINLGSIRWIPRAIGQLNQLETLDLSGSQTVTVFKEVLLLPKLKHLFGKFQLSRSDIPSVPVLGLFESSLEWFLREESVLETLDGFVIGKRYGFAQLMSLMKMLRKVKIWCSSKPKASRKNLGVISRAIMKFIRDGTDEPHRGQSLSIDYAECKTEFVNGIVPVAGNLYSLKLRGKLRQFPPFVAGLSDIEELCLCSTGLSWELIRDGLSNVKGLKYLKLIEDDLGRMDIEVAHLKSIQRICIVSNTTIDIAIQTDALPYLVSLHILCENLNVIPGTPGIEITHMKELNEIALHPRVAGGIKTRWQQAASGHPYKHVRVIEGPP